ncbi:MAG: hypothetical protein AAGD06_27525 [Acidobacteriota bacterium]
MKAIRLVLASCVVFALALAVDLVADHESLTPTSHELRRAVVANVANDPGGGWSADLQIHDGAGNLVDDPWAVMLTLVCVEGCGDRGDITTGYRLELPDGRPLGEHPRVGVWPEIGAGTVFVKPIAGVADRVVRLDLIAIPLSPAQGQPFSLAAGYETLTAQSAG